MRSSILRRLRALADVAWVFGLFCPQFKAFDSFFNFGDLLLLGDECLLLADLVEFLLDGILAIVAAVYE
jgi:hypothetical protein